MKVTVEMEGASKLILLSTGREMFKVIILNGGIHI